MILLQNVKNEPAPSRDKFAVLRKSVDSDWTVVAVWDTWQEADRDCEERRNAEQDQAMFSWERVTADPNQCCCCCDTRRKEDVSE